MSSPSAPVWRATSAMLVLWGGEIALARISGEPQRLGDVLASGGQMAFCGLLVGLCARAAAGRRTLLVVHAGLWIVGMLMPLCIVIEVLEPVQRSLSGPAHTVLGVLACGGPLLLAGLVSWRSHTVVPSPWVCAALVPAAALGAWSLEGWPHWVVVAGIVAVPMLLAAQAAWLQPRWLSGIALVLLPVVLARWPAAPPSAEWTAQGEAPGGPDILLITVDTLRADAAEDMRSAQRLAEHGHAYQHAQSSSPWTLPSMASVFTGQGARAHGAGRLPDGSFTRLDSDQPTVATVLAEVGYDTAAVVGASPYLGADFGFDRGFAVFDHARQRRLHALPRRGYRGRGARLVMGQAAAERGLLSADTRGDAHEIVDRAISILEQRRDRPLFLWLHFMDPHLPYTHAQDLDLDRQLAARLAVLGRREALKLADLYPHDLLRRAYDNEVGHVDRALLRLLDALPHDPDRVVVLSADHGEEFGEHGGFEHGHSFFQELLAVPLVVAGMDLEQAPAGLVDIGPTLAAVGGAALPIGPGLDLRQAPASRAFCASNLMHGEHQGTGQAIHRGRNTVIEMPNDRPMSFDLGADPGQLAPLEMLSEAPGLPLLATCAPPTPPSPEAAPIDADTRDLMRSLGYLDRE